MADTAPTAPPDEQKNYFLDKYGPPQDESTPEGKSNAAAVETVDKAQNNYFVQTYGDPAESANFKPVNIDNSPTIGQRAGGLALEAGKGAAGATQATAAALGTVTASVPVLFDKLHSALSGVEDTSAQDWWFKTFVDPAVAAVHQDVPDPALGVAGKLANAAGSTLETIAQMVVTGGEALPEAAAGQVAQQGVARTVAAQSANAAKMATVPAVASAVNRGRDVYQQTGDAKQGIAAAQADYLTQAIGAVMPLSKAGGLMTRLATGGVSGAVTGELGREMQNATVSDPLQQPFSMEDAAINATAGAITGAVMGPRAEQPLAQPPQRSAVDAVSDAVAEKGVLPQIQLKARQDAAARGGDEMDQEIAASMATLQHTELARHMMLRDSQDKAFADAAQQDAVARQQAQQDAADRYEAQQVAQTKAPANPVPSADAGFAQAEAARAADQQKTTQEAYAQREEQKGADIEQQAPYAPERATTKLGDVAPDDVKSAGVPAGNNSVETPEKPATPVEPAPEAKPVGPLDIRLAKPTDDSEAWGITVHDKLLASYEDEATARKQLRTMRSAIREHAATRDAETTQVPQLKGGEPVTPAEGPLLPETSASISANIGHSAKVTTPEQISEAAKASAFHPDNELPTPTDAQYRAQNYPMGHTEIQGLPVTIEHPAGSERPLGGPLKGETRTMPAHYGYFKGTVDADGQHTDVVIGKQPDAPSAFVVDHLSADGQYEQHKVMMGYPNELAAKRDYKKIYPDRPVGPVTEMPIAKLKSWLGKGDTSAPLQPDKIKPLAAARPEKAAARGARSLDFAENNASGESSASMEAISRVQQDREKGQARYVVDPDGGVTPLHGVDAVDQRAPQGHIIVQKGGGGENSYSILDRGGLPQTHARGLLNRAMDKLNSANRDPVFREGGAPTRKSPTKDQVEEHIAPLLDKVGRDNVTVHDSINADTVPKYLKRAILAKAEAQNYDPNQIRGVYDRNTDSVHIFAGAHSSLESSARTAVHEIVAHKGLSYLLGDEREPVMRDIYNNADRKWIDDFVKQHGLDDTNPEHQRLAGEEYAAHLAERSAGAEPPTILRKTIDSIRKVLRKMGIVKHWSDPDIHALLRDSASGLAKASAHGKANEDRSDPLKFATDQERDPRVEKDPEHPLSQLAKYGATMEAQVNKSQGSFIRSRYQAVKDFGQNHIETLLKAIPRRNLPDFMSPGKMPAAAEYVRQANRMDGRRNELLTKSEEIGRNWNRYTTKNKAGGRALGEMMHASTLAGVDPSKDYVPRYVAKRGRPLSDADRVLEMQRRQQYQALKPFWDKMDPQAKQIFHQVRDHYVDQRRMVEEGLMKRIGDSQASGAVKNSLMDELRQKFEAGRVQEPYFPLARFGDYWAVAKGEDGETASFSRFEAPSDQRAWRSQMEEHGFDVDGGKKMDNGSIMKKVDPAFVGKIADHLNTVDPKLADDVWQHFLRNMPEMSMRKAFIHRQGRLGFTADALRAFGSSTFHSAHQIAKLENVHQLDGHLNNMQQQARQLEVDNDPEAHWAAPVVKEMNARHEWAMQPQASSIAAKLTALGHFWYLGTSPAHAFIFATQNPMVAYPTLSAKHGWIPAGRELLKAQGQYAGSRGPLANRLRGNERDAFDEAQRIGLFARTNAYTLLGVRDAGEGYNPNSVWTHAKEVSGYLLHKTDEMNRQTTFLAAYRLARTDGMDHNAAIQHAEDMTWDSHFDYSNANRPQLLQSSAAKVVFLFRQYMMNMAYRIARDTRNGLIPGEASSANTPALRSEARQRMAGVLGQIALAAGATGMPLYWMVEGIVNSVMGDKDKPYDMTTAVRAHLTQQYGPTASKAIMDGPFDAVTGATLSSRVEMNNLFLKDIPPELDGQDKFLHLLGELAGPIGSMAMSGFEAAKLAHEGQSERAIETLAPKVVRDQMKAVRFAREGAVNLKGEQVMDKDEFTKKDIFMQSMGFTPADLQTRYEQNTAIKQEADQIQQRRSFLMNQLMLAAHNDDPQGVQETMDEVTKFNGRNPGVAIRADNIIGAARSRAKMSAETIDGLRVAPGLSGLRPDMNFETQNPQETPPQ